MSRDIATGKWPSRILAAAASVVGVVIGGTVFLLDHQQTHRPPASASQTSTLVPGVEGFGSPRQDIFGRRVDVPLDPSGVVLPQNGVKV
jgi:hypothetical protein